MKGSAGTALMYEDEFLELTDPVESCDDIMVLSNDKEELTSYRLDRDGKYLIINNRTDKIGIMNELNKYGGTINSLDAQQIATKFTEEFMEEWND